MWRGVFGVFIGLLAKCQSNALTRSVTVNLMGDPSIRLDIVAPASNVSASVNDTNVTLNWLRSPDPVIGYHIYRSTSEHGPFAKVTVAPVAGNSFGDSIPRTPGRWYYMVRALMLQQNGSGTYYNLSQGSFGTAEVTQNASSLTPVQTVTMTSSGPNITWNTVVGKSYRVEAIDSLLNRQWSNISGSLTANSEVLDFTDSDWIWYPSRFYRIVVE